MCSLLSNTFKLKSWSLLQRQKRIIIYLLRQKVRQGISVIPENWHFYSRFVLKTTKTSVFVFITEILWRTFWRNKWRSDCKLWNLPGYLKMIRLLLNYCRNLFLIKILQLKHVVIQVDFYMLKLTKSQTSWNSLFSRLIIMFVREEWR